MQSDDEWCGVTFNLLRFDIIHPLTMHRKPLPHGEVCIGVFDHIDAETSVAFERALRGWVGMLWQGHDYFIAMQQQLL